MQMNRKEHCSCIWDLSETKDSWIYLENKCTEIVIFDVYLRSLCLTHVKGPFSHFIQTNTFR